MKVEQKPVVRQFTRNHSNPTYLIDFGPVYQRYVLRKKPPGELQPSTHAIEREYKCVNETETQTLAWRLARYLRVATNGRDCCVFVTSRSGVYFHTGLSQSPGEYRTRFGSLELKIGSLESAKIIIRSQESEKIGSLETKKSGPFRSIPGNIFHKKNCLHIIFLPLR